MNSRNPITVLMSAFLFSWKRDRTSTYLAFDGALLLSSLSPPHDLLLPVSLKGGEMKYSEGAVSAQCASIRGMCCGMAAGRLNCFKEANLAGHGAGRATHAALRFQCSTHLYLWSPIRSQIDRTLSFRIKFTNHTCHVSLCD